MGSGTFWRAPIEVLPKSIKEVRRLARGPLVPNGEQQRLLAVYQTEAMERNGSNSHTAKTGDRRRYKMMNCLHKIDRCYESFAELLYRLRTQRGISQLVVGQLACWANGNRISIYELGRALPQDEAEVRRIAHALRDTDEDAETEALIHAFARASLRGIGIGEDKLTTWFYRGETGRCRLCPYR